MLMNVTVIPFLTWILANVPNRSYFDPEYLYEVNQTTIVHKEPLQITQVTSTIKCHSFPPISLRCFLPDIMYVTSFEHKNLNFTEEVTREQFKVGQWFEMKFNVTGLQSTLIQENADTVVKNFIKYIVQQFNINLNVYTYIPYNHQYKHGYEMKISKPEKTLIAGCITRFHIDVQYKTKNATRYSDSNFTLTMMDNFTMHEYAHLFIVKDRQNCSPTIAFIDFFNSMQVTKYDHTIDSSDYRIKTSTKLDVGHPSNPWNPSGIPIFTEITEVNMIDMTFHRTLKYVKNYNLIELKY